MPSHKDSDVIEENVEDLINQEDEVVTPPAPRAAPRAVAPTMSKDGLYILGLGRRKTAVARVRLKDGGTGKVTVNKKDIAVYFPREEDRRNLMDPMRIAKVQERFDIFITCNGGGMTGQSGAARLGIARALVSIDNSLIDPFRQAGLLTRDSRRRERKKYGKRGARASYQYSKR